jgi:hypothetical protein
LVSTDQLGPLDLGSTILRFPIRVDPRTARLTLSSSPADQLPTILSGIVLHPRDVRLYVDRPDFTLNPTSCAPSSISAGAFANTGELASLSQRFQAADCTALPFSPRLALRLSGGLARNGHPALRAALRQRSSEAAIAAASFTLPAGELLDLHHIRVLCPGRLSSGHCPSGSRIGWLRVRSPLIDDRLEGPIYLRQPSHRLPDLLIDLRGGGVHLVLHGHTATAGGRLRIRLGALPDLPLSMAVLTLAGGRRGILANSESLCARTLRATALLEAHSGRRRSPRPRLRLRGHC